MRRYSSTLPVPGWPGGGGIRWSYSFAGLFFVSTFSRAILISVLPLQALELLGDAQAVSVLYFSVASIGIVASIAIPNLVRRIGSHATFFLGLIAMIISVVLLSSESTPVFVIGLPLHFLSVAAIEVPLNFYILSEVPRRELTRFEPLRILCTVLAYTVGPWLGVFLESRVDHMLPFVLAIGSTVVTMWHFGWLRLGDTGDAISAGPLVNPLRHVRRFFGQPRMRLAWALALARSSWWMTFMVYTPIYAELSGLGSLVGAGLVSIGTAWTFTVPLFVFAAAATWMLLSAFLCRYVPRGM